jgi:hypothetical protein
MVNLNQYGEGFWVTMAFLLFTMMLLVAAMATGNEVAKSVAVAAIAIDGSIAAFWFATRGQTSQTQT